MLQSICIFLVYLMLNVFDRHLIFTAHVSLSIFFKISVRKNNIQEYKQPLLQLK